MTVHMFAARKQWPLENAQVTLRHSREHNSDCEGGEDTPAKPDVIEHDIRLEGELSDEQRARLMEIAGKCPVHRTLTGTLVIRTQEV